MESLESRIFLPWLVIDQITKITAVGIDHDGKRIFVGLEDGMLEEYALESLSDGIHATLTAKKPIVYQQPILSLHPAIPSNCIIALTADGSIRFIHSDTFESKIMHKGPVLALSLCLNYPYSDRPVLAIATKSGLSRSLHVSVHEIHPEGGRIPSWTMLWNIPITLPSQTTTAIHTVQSLSWAGRSLIMGVNNNRYILLQPDHHHGHAHKSHTMSESSTHDVKVSCRDLLAVPPLHSPSPSSYDSQHSHSNGDSSNNGAGCSILVSVSLPRMNAAMVIANALALCIDENGDPLGNPILITVNNKSDDTNNHSNTSYHSSRHTTSAIHGGSGGGAAGRTNLMDKHCSNSAWEHQPVVLAMASGDGFVIAITKHSMHILDPCAGQCLQRIEDLPGMLMQKRAAVKTASGGRADSAVVLVAGTHSVLCLTPVPLQLRAREAMIQGKYSTVDDVINMAMNRKTHGSDGGGGGLHSHTSHVDSTTLLHSNTYGLQWIEEAYAQCGLLLLQGWKGKEGTYTDVDESDDAVHRAMEYLERCSPATFQAGELFSLFPEHTAAWLPCVHAPLWKLHAPLDARHAQRDALLARSKSKRSIVEYLFRARQLPGTTHLDGIDTLLLHLLIDIHAMHETLAYVTIPHEIRIDDAVIKRLESIGWHHVLATLLASTPALHRDAPGNSTESSQLKPCISDILIGGGDSTEKESRLKQALLIWKEIAVGKLTVPCAPDLGAGYANNNDKSSIAMGDARTTTPAAAAVIEEGESIEHKPSQKKEHAMDITMQHRHAMHDEAIENITRILTSQQQCPATLVLVLLPWLLTASPSSAQRVLVARDDLPPTDVLPLLARGDDARWWYLLHVVQCSTPPYSSTAPGNTDTDASSDRRPSTKDHSATIQASSCSEPGLDAADIHTELALSLIDALFKRDPNLIRGEAAGMIHGKTTVPQSTPYITLNNHTNNGDATAAAAAAGGGGSGDINEAGDGQKSGDDTKILLDNKKKEMYQYRPEVSLATLFDRHHRRHYHPSSDIDTTTVSFIRSSLQHHLESSLFLRIESIQDALAPSCLHEERAILAMRCAEHDDALRGIALKVRAAGAAIAYAKAYLDPSEGGEVLLRMLLDPENEGGPLWNEAARVVAAFGATLDPLQILRAVSVEIPLNSAIPLLDPLLRERIHRRRQGQIKSALYGSRAAAEAVLKVAAEAHGVVIDEERACLDCHLKLANKVFVVVPNVPIETTQQQDERCALESTEMMKTRGTPAATMMRMNGAGGMVVCLHCWERRKKEKETIF